jgi:hypothetical protein
MKRRGGLRKVKKVFMRHFPLRAVPLAVARS